MMGHERSILVKCVMNLSDHGKLQYVMICLVLVGPALPGVSVSVG